MSSAKQNAPSTREMERINWLEFREWVPAKIQTVLLPLGTLEPHGVAPNGTDILAPVAIGARDRTTRQRDDCACNFIRIHWNHGRLPGELHSSRGHFSQLCSRGPDRSGEEQIQEHYSAERARRRADGDFERASARGRPRDEHQNSS